MSSENHFVAENTFYVRYSETDAMGIVHHASYIVFFEEGRSHYARQRGHSYAEFEQTGHFLVVSEVNARYQKPAHYGQLITVRCWIEAMKSRSLTFAYEIVDAESKDSLVTGYSKHICLTRAGQVTRIPEIWRGWSTG